MEHIRIAAAALDNAKDKDWTEDGKPSLTRVRQLAKDNTITQAQLDEAVPDMVRVKKEERTVAVIEKSETGRDYPDAVSGVMMIALEKGYYGGSIREPETVFSFTGIPGKWMREATKEEIANWNAMERQRQKAAGERGGVWANEISKYPG